METEKHIIDTDIDNDADIADIASADALGSSPSHVIYANG